MESELESESESDSTLESKFLYRGGNSPGSNRCFKDLLGREEGNRDGRRGRRKLGGKKGGKRGRRERGGKAAAVRERERDASTHAWTRTHAHTYPTHSQPHRCVPAMHTFDWRPGPHPKRNGVTI